MKASKLVADAVYYAGLKQLVTTEDDCKQDAFRPAHLLYYLQFKHLDPDIIVDVTDTFHASRAGISAFGSQFYHEGSSEEPATLINRKEFLTGLEARTVFRRTDRLSLRRGAADDQNAGVTTFSTLFP